MTSFNVNAYLGVWWEIGKIPFKYQLPCYYSSAEYTLNSDILDIKNYCYDEKYNMIGSAEGYGIKIDDMRYKVRFTEYNINNINLPYDDEENNGRGQSNYIDKIHSNYNILYTDYNNISLVGSDDQFWILSRYRTLELKYINFIKDIAMKNGYDINKILINRELII